MLNRTTTKLHRVILQKSQQITSHNPAKSAQGNITSMLTLSVKNAKPQTRTAFPVKKTLLRTVRHVLKGISSTKPGNARSVKITAKHAEVRISAIFVHLDPTWSSNKSSTQGTVRNAMETVSLVSTYQRIVLPAGQGTS